MVFVFHSIDNFRDLADSVKRRSKVCSRAIFRSATLDYASEQDLEKLVEELQVNTILDLRSEVEAQISKMGKTMVSFPVATTLKLKPSDMAENDPEPSVHEKLDGPTRKTVMINFAGQRFRKYAVWKAAPLKTKMQIVGLIAAGQKPKAVKLVGEEIIARKGLSGLYRDFIDYCDQEICEALKVLADHTNYPILIHCTQGKDRTGLVTALALAAAGIDEEKIIEDYAKSQQGLQRVRAHMVKEMEKDGLDPSFADAPPEIMRQTFEYIREKYSGVKGYLDYIGFDENSRIGLKRALTFRAMQMGVMDDSPPTEAVTRKLSGASLTSKSDVESTDVESNGEPEQRDLPAVTESKEDSKEEKEEKSERIENARHRRPSMRDKSSWRRGSDASHGSASKMSLKYLVANPRSGFELLGSGLGLALPLSKAKHHRGSVSDDESSKESHRTRDDGFIPDLTSDEGSPRGGSSEN